MSLPSQQRRGAASGRASLRGVRKSRRKKQGVPAPLKGAVALALLVIVLWTGWRVLMPGEAGPVTTPALTNLDSQANGNESGDASLNAIMNPGGSGEADSGRLADRPISRSTEDDPIVINNGPSGATREEQFRATQQDLALAAAELEAQQTAGPEDPPTRVLPEPVQTTRFAAQQPETKGTTAQAIRSADTLAARGEAVRARTLLNNALLASTTTDSERVLLRARLQELNEKLIFSPLADPSDPMTEMYRVQSGDSLARIVNRRDLATHFKLIARVNGITDPSKIRIGQSLKLVRGPFHAVVDKSDYRMDVYQGPPDAPRSWTFIRSFPIGLGEGDGTPAGSFVISSNKLENPGWVNPRDSRERYDRNDPNNPIGEYWLGLDGLGEFAAYKGFGIHGTTEPESIGRSMSMGCVRLGDADVSLVFELLEEQISVVHIIE